MIHIREYSETEHRENGTEIREKAGLKVHLIQIVRPVEARHTAPGLPIAMIPLHSDWPQLHEIVESIIMRSC